ncbi:hypothetical protein POM88_030147 [Heracleum sosnowskyi]|uniref:Protein kinase domain-containing protein n=1 Tax=Heracleum sosnowskyi TaxID=360622 RepID=A0AAD8MIE8_9APIA|nr:hypothetical protein POM88_030147 [Heracleum sosnowskyi]
MDSEFLGEGLIPTLQHAHDNLLVENPETVPYQTCVLNQLSEPFKIFEFDFSRRPDSHGEVELHIKATKDGTIHVVGSCQHCALFQGKCAEAVLRGAQVFVPGVLACSAHVEEGDVVAVSVALEQSISEGKWGTGITRGTVMQGLQTGKNPMVMIQPIAVEDVKREVKILQALSGHENVVQFYNAFEDENFVYIAME